MRWRGFTSPLATDAVAAVVAWIAVMAAMLIVGGGLLAIAGLLGFDTMGWVLLIVVPGSLAILFGGGFICSRLSASRAGVWLLIALLVGPGLLGARWSNPISVQLGGSSISGWEEFLIGVVVLPVAIAFTWLATILPVLAGANYERRRRTAAR